MTDLRLQCSCGKVAGVARNVSATSGTRLVCYCDDCQAFARYLDREDTVLDQHGGTDIFQLTPSQVEITQGSEQLRSLRLSEKGMFRWYTECCKTPIANTASAGLPFVGMIHSFMDAGAYNSDARTAALGPVRSHVQTRFATALPADMGHPGFPLGLIFRSIRKILIAKLRGRGRPSPFFDAGGAPVATPIILDRESNAQ
jgi:hypothetical protein